MVPVRNVGVVSLNKPNTSTDEVKSNKRTIWLNSIVIISSVEAIFFAVDASFRSDDQYSEFTQWFIVDSDAPKWHFWRLATYILVHVNFQHIAGNLFCQLATGVPLDFQYGWKRVTFIYFGGAIAGSLSVVIFSSCKYLVGCSGGTYSIIGAYLCHLIVTSFKNQQSTPTTRCNVFFIFMLSVCLTVTFIQELCFPEQVPNQFIRPLYESRYCRINSALSNTVIVHLVGLIFGVASFFFNRYFQKAIRRLHEFTISRWP